MTVHIGRTLLGMPHDPDRRSKLDPERCSGARIAHSSQTHATVSHAVVDLVVLSDYLVATRLVRDLHSRGVPHLAVPAARRHRAGGPAGHPGVTSCLGSYKE